MNFLKYFKTRDLILIAILATIGLVIKPIVSPLSKAISTPLMIPGGSFAGGFYMMWMVLALMLTGKTGAASIFGFIQAVVVMVQGAFGNHGALSLLSYTLPGIMADIAYGLLFKRSKSLLLQHLSLTALANMTGAAVLAIVIFRHPLVLLLASICLALASGMVGGYMSWLIHYELKKLDLIRN